MTIIAADEFDCDFRQRLPLVLLEEVAGAGDRRVGHPLGTRDPVNERPVEARGDRVRVAEGAQKRLLPPRQHLPRRPVGF